MNSIVRNRELESLAQYVRNKPALARELKKGYSKALDAEFDEALDRFTARHGDLSTPLKMRGEGPPLALIQIVLELASREPAASEKARPDAGELERAFLAACPREQRQRASELLDLARASYQLRDDDNIYIHGVEMQLDAAVAEGRRRLQIRGEEGAEALPREEVQRRLGGIPVETHGHRSPNLSEAGAGKRHVRSSRVKDRQLIGQPACPGVAGGPARVIQKYDDLMDFKQGEVLVCDAISPTVTFAVPLASAIIERRGGMLIHGAIIAREYGIPCVTGVPDAAERICTGDQLTVDGYLGIVKLET
jgi:pyruvate,water dikinase